MWVTDDAEVITEKVETSQDTLNTVIYFLTAHSSPLTSTCLSDFLGVQHGARLLFRPGQAICSVFLSSHFFHPYLPEPHDGPHRHRIDMVRRLLLRLPVSLWNQFWALWAPLEDLIAYCYTSTPMFYALGISDVITDLLILILPFFWVSHHTHCT